MALADGETRPERVNLFTNTSAQLTSSTLHLKM
jgi:hypothetical protein